MHTNEKADRVIWQVTDTSGFPILGRTQAKLMNYISYPEIHAPQQQQSFQSPEIVSSLQTPNSTSQNLARLYRLHNLWIVYRLNPNLTRNLTDWSKFDQTAQEEHRVATEAKLGAAHEPKSPQVSRCKNSITIDGKTHPLPTTKEYILHEYADVLKALELCQVVHTT